MNVHQAIVERQTIHDYALDDVAEDALERALLAALSAPNHHMTEPWRFTRVGRQTRGPLADIAIELKASKAGGHLDPSTADKARAKMLNPPVLLVVSQVRAGDPVTEREDYAAVACAIQNLSLSLFAEGIGSKWSTGGVTKDPRTYQLLSIKPELEEIVGFVWVGIAAKNCPKVPRRRSLSEVLRQLP